MNIGRPLTGEQIGCQTSDFPIGVRDRELESPLIEQEIERIGDFLLQQEMTRDQQLIRLIREGGLPEDCPLGVEVPSDSCVGGDNDIGFEHMKTRRRAGHKPKPMRGEFDGTAIPVLGGVVDLEKHLVGLRKWSLPSRVMSKPV